MRENKKRDGSRKDYLGWPAPEMEWSKDGIVITRNTHPHITVSNIGGRVSLNFSQCTVNDSGEYHRG